MSKESTSFYRIVVTAGGEYLLRGETVDYGTYRTKPDAEAAIQRVIKNETYHYNKEGIEINV